MQAHSSYGSVVDEQVVMKNDTEHSVRQVESVSLMRGQIGQVSNDESIPHQIFKYAVRQDSASSTLALLVVF